MPAFRVQVFKRIAFSDREWSNTYRVMATDLAAASGSVSIIAGKEKLLHGDGVTLVRARVSDVIVGTDVFEIVSLGIVGEAYVSADNDIIPLFNTMRVDISVTGGGRPSRKYYRPPVPEIWQVNSFFNPTVVTLFTNTVQSLITDMAAASTPLVDPEDQAWATAQAFGPVQMRQLHRKRKKKVVSP